MSGPTSLLRPAGTLANRIFHIATVISTFDNHLPNQHYRNQQQQYCTKQGGHFPEQGDFNIVFSFAMAAGYEGYVGRI